MEGAGECMEADQWGGRPDSETGKLGQLVPAFLG